jgi:hypothetical protein
MKMVIDGQNVSVKAVSCIPAKIPNHDSPAVSVELTVRVGYTPAMDWKDFRVSTRLWEVITDHIEQIINAD